MQAVMNYLDNFVVEGGYCCEACLDGLAVAQDFNWSSKEENSHLVIHICDIITHTNWPDPKQHSRKKHMSSCQGKYCCCCSGKCSNDWNRDVFKPFLKFHLQYFLVFTGSMNSPSYNKKFEAFMIDNLGRDLCQPARF